MGQALASTDEVPNNQFSWSYLNAKLSACSQLACDNNWVHEWTALCLLQTFIKCSLLQHFTHILHWSRSHMSVEKRAQNYRIERMSTTCSRRTQQAIESQKQIQIELDSLSSPINQLQRMLKPSGTRRSDATEYMMSMYSRGFLSNDCRNRSAIVCVHIEDGERTIWYVTWRVMELRELSYSIACVIHMHPIVTKSGMIDAKNLDYERVVSANLIRAHCWRSSRLVKLHLRLKWLPADRHDNLETMLEVCPAILFVSIVNDVNRWCAFLLVLFGGHPPNYAKSGHSTSVPSNSYQYARSLPSLCR